MYSRCRWVEPSAICSTAICSTAICSTAICSTLVRSAVVRSTVVRSAVVRSPVVRSTLARASMIRPMSTIVSLADDVSTMTMAIPTLPTHNLVGLNTPLSSSKPLREKVTKRVKEYMGRFDASHDFQHIMRVLKLADRLFADTPVAGYQYDETAVHLAALLHDVGDKKYIKPGENAETMVATILIECGASIELAQKVWTIVRNVSFSNEVRNPVQVQEALRKHPELAIVQDADRLDSLGAVGVCRAFTYGGANGRENGLQGSIDHFSERLFRISELMKTELGREMARKRTERLQMFKSWWEEECQVMS